MKSTLEKIKANTPDLKLPNVKMPALPTMPAMPDLSSKTEALTSATAQVLDKVASCRCWLAILPQHIPHSNMYFVLVCSAQTQALQKLRDESTILFVVFGGCFMLGLGHATPGAITKYLSTPAPDQAKDK